jgi:hypothetical protein
MFNAKRGGKKMEPGMVAAADMARHAGVDPKAFRKRLRAEKERGHFQWHVHGGRWVVPEESSQHHELQQILRDLMRS